MLQDVGVVAVGRNFEAERKFWKMVMGEVDFARRTRTPPILVILVGHLFWKNRSALL